MQAQNESSENTQSGEHDHVLPLSALKALEQELAALGWQTRLHADEKHPYLRISLDAAYREYVFVASYDEPAYRWSNVAREHPLDDPAGAVERIVGDLALRHVQQGLERSRG